MNKIYPILLILLMAACGPGRPLKQELGTGWEMKMTSGQAGFAVADTLVFPASVPGCVHLDLLANGLIDDPYYRDNEATLQWIGEAGWEYTCSFIPSPEIMEKEQIELVFEGLDTYAGVYLNDSLILEADNTFRSWVVDVKDVLQEGENRLSVLFSPPGAVNSEKAAALPYRFPDERAFTRKSPYHFGWDWGPAFITAGIWKEVFLRAWNGLRIDRVHVTHGSLADTSALEVTAGVFIRSAGKQHARITLYDDEDGRRLATADADLVAGMNKVTLSYRLERPGLWWPAGMGKQNLYRIRTKIRSGGEHDENLSTFGIRQIELVREPDKEGESFYFRVNGVPLFMKGANYAPMDNFLPRVDSARYAALIRSVADANMNMLRVWGGGFYENDIFYDLCDEHGIMVWQDFMFACNLYPGDEAFLENVKAEAACNLARLSNHPCIALWCGNNEIDEGWHNWGWQRDLGYSDEDSAKIWNDYLKIFHEILPYAVEQHVPGTPYHPSSPMTGWGRDEAYMRGDVHYWGVWWGEEPFEMYDRKVGRFVSEYGFQGMPPMETIRSFTRPGDRHTGSPVMEAHQKHPRGTALIQLYMEREFVVPADFGDYVYLSQVLQAEGMGRAFYSHRIAQPRCMGTLYWQLNDCWPVTSWSGLDYYGRWKALHYHVKRAYAPLMVRAVEKDGTINVHVLNDHRNTKTLDLLFEMSDFTGRVLSRDVKSIQADPHSNNHVFSMTHDGEEPGNRVFIARLFHEAEEVSNSFLYFVPTREMQLSDPGLQFEVLDQEDGPIIRITSVGLARQVFLEMPGANARFSDNFFDMAPGETKTIHYSGDAGPDGIREKLLLRSIFNTL